MSDCDDWSSIPQTYDNSRSHCLFMLSINTIIQPSAPQREIEVALCPSNEPRIQGRVHGCVEAFQDWLCGVAMADSLSFVPNEQMHEAFSILTGWNSEP